MKQHVLGSKGIHFFSSSHRIEFTTLDTKDKDSGIRTTEGAAGASGAASNNWLRPLGSLEKLHTFENVGWLVGWLVSRPTEMRVTFRLARM